MRSVQWSFFAAVILLAMSGRAVIAEDQPQDKPSQLLTTVAQLKQMLNSDGKAVIMIDSRDKTAFAAGHLPGARWVDVSRWKAAALAKGGAGLKDQRAWRQLGRELGLTLDARIVVYGGSLPSAARVWWLLKYIGCDHVSLLDGGVTTWNQAGHAVTRRAVKVAKSEFEPKFQPQRLAGIDEVKQSAQGKDLVVFDTRSTGEFAAGRVPGSVHIEWTQMITQQGKFKSPQELRKLFGPSALGPKQTAVTYCRSGGRASVEAFALELAGYKNVKNYFCSWQQYSKDETAEVEK